MKKLMLGTAMAVIFTSGASAQDLFRAESDPVAITASDFIGMRVYASEAVDAEEYQGVQDGWEDIGEINDVILTRDGKVDSVLLDIGGFLGMGERQVAVGMENIRFVADSATAENLNDFFLVVQADRTVLEGAPEYRRSDAMPATDGAAADTATEDTAMTDPALAPADGTAPADGNMTTEAEAGTDTSLATDNTVADGTRSLEGYTAVDPAGVRVEQLTGVRVYGPADEDIGEISDLVLDDSGMVGAVIIDVGGFLGIGEKPVAINMTDLQFMQANDGDTLRAYVSMTKEQVESLPAAEM